jgi:ABC-2 type transport system ATP-binding protein
MLTSRRLAGGAAALIILAGLVVWAAWPSRPTWRTSWQTLSNVDTTFFLPKAASAAHPVPAVLLAHGFGGTKDSVREQASELAGHGYAVLTWSAEGFGRSGGQIHLNSPDYEVRDAQRLLDWLATQPSVRRDGPGDPRVAAVGGSYGGALALLLAGYDRRVDAIVPMITWNDLSQVFLPDGVFKKGWAGLFFGNAGDPANPACGRFAPDVCQAYQRIASTGRAGAADLALLRRSSPSSVLDRITAPTLLIQGEADSLFPLSEADANARGIAANGTPVEVAWYTGGHDGGAGPSSDQDRLNSLTEQWLARWLSGAPSSSSNFTWSRVTGLDTVNQGVRSGAYSAARYPGLGGTGSTTVPLAGGPAHCPRSPSSVVQPTPPCSGSTPRWTTG